MHNNSQQIPQRTAHLPPVTPKWRSALRLPVIALTLCSLSTISANALAKTFELTSPNEQLKIEVHTGKQTTFEVHLKNKQVLAPSSIDLMLMSGEKLASNITVKQEKRYAVSNTLTPAVSHKSSKIAENYNALNLAFSNNFGLDFRAYNDGFAYRFTGERAGEIIIKNEHLALNFTQNATTLFPEEETFISHFERLYLPESVANISPKRFASLPTYIKSNDVNVVVTEADLYDYPGLFLFGTNKNGFTAGFPNAVAKTTPKAGSEDRNQEFEYENYIAKTSGTRTFPWRVAIITQEDTDLVASQLVYLLSSENKIGDTRWIKPGRIAWDWYNANNLFDVDFKAGLNTQTYKYYIDFAAEYGLEYVILDEGWTKTTTNTKESNPDIDVKELIAYGKKKNVAIILWTLWEPLDKDYENILALYAQWGAAGIKVDFMQRADQYMVNYYEKIAKAAAKNKLLVDYHGGFKPAGLRRAYPNVMTYEGVKGNENNKWSADITPEHNVTLPYIRMVAGPMDYTPGALRNKQLANHNVNHFRPEAIGTRAHQLAMYAVFESALQMLCESPSTYLREPLITEYIAKFPSVWDETRVLKGEVANYILLARRKGDTWYIGAMTDMTARTLTLNLSFLDGGKYSLHGVADGLNVEQYAEDYQFIHQTVTAKDSLQLNLAAGGGWSAVITPAK